MTFIFEDCREGDTEGETRTFKTLRGATSHGAKLLNAYGYLAANRYEGDTRFPRHVVAEWKNNGKILGKVWT